MSNIKFNFMKCDINLSWLVYLKFPFKINLQIIYYNPSNVTHFGCEQKTKSNYACLFKCKLATAFLKKAEPLHNILTLKNEQNKQISNSQNFRNDQ